MGVDIEMFAERRTPTGWEPASDPVKDPYGRGSLRPAEVADFGRPYKLFSVLAACPVNRFVGELKVPFISKPRGFPDDLHEVHVRHFWNLCDLNDSAENDASWLLVQEILDFDWDGQRAELYGYIEREFAHLFDVRKPFPKEISKGKSLYLDPREGTEKVCWSTPLREYVGCLEWFIGCLLPLGPPDQVRVVYWFSY